MGLRRRGIEGVCAGRVDVGDKANAGGALIVVGAEQDAQGRLARIVALPPADYELGLRIHQIVAQRVSPIVAVTHWPLDADGKLVHLISVAPTTRPPHGVDVGGGALRYPVRSGVTRRFLSEPEIADWYQRRFVQVADLRDRFEAHHANAHELIPDPKPDDPWGWLVITMVPEMPGRLDMRRSLLNDCVKWLRPTLDESPGFNRMTQMQATPALRSIRLHDDLNRSTLAIYSSGGVLGLDRCGSMIFGHPNRTLTPSAREAVVVYDEHLVADVVNAVSALARHAGRAGATGNVVVGAELVVPTAMVIGHYRSMFQGQLPGTRLVTRSTGRSEHTVTLDGLVTPGPDVVAVARLVVGDLVSAFGVADVQQITPDDELVLDQFYAPQRPAVEAWANAASVPVVESFPGT